jgi:hypothetical protein
MLSLAELGVPLRAVIGYSQGLSDWGQADFERRSIYDDTAHDDFHQLCPR